MHCKKVIATEQLDYGNVIENAELKIFCLMFLPGYGPKAIADWSIIVQCHLLVKH
jgi:hypothetical protein